MQGGPKESGIPGVVQDGGGGKAVGNPSPDLAGMGERRGDRHSAKTTRPASLHARGPDANPGLGDFFGLPGAREARG